MYRRTSTEQIHKIDPTRDPWTIKNCKKNADLSHLSVVCKAPVSAYSIRVVQFFKKKKKQLWGLPPPLSHLAGTCEMKNALCVRNIS